MLNRIRQNWHSARPTIRSSDPTRPAPAEGPPSARGIDAPEYRGPAPEIAGGASEGVGLIYELLDAHQDTIRMAAALRHQPEWGAHIDYLRALQREGRATLAKMGEPG